MFHQPDLSQDHAVSDWPMNRKNLYNSAIIRSYSKCVGKPKHDLQALACEDQDNYQVKNYLQVLEYSRSRIQIFSLKTDLGQKTSKKEASNNISQNSHNLTPKGKACPPEDQPVHRPPGRYGAKKAHLGPAGGYRPGQTSSVCEQVLHVDYWLKK